MEPTKNTEDKRTDENVEEGRKAKEALEQLARRAAKVPMEGASEEGVPESQPVKPSAPEASPIVHLSVAKGLAFLEFDNPVTKVSLTPKLCHQLGKRLMKISRSFPGR